MYNFFHVYKYHLGVLAALLIGVGVIRFPLDLFADTTSFFTNTTTTTTSSGTSLTTATPVTFSVNPTSDVDCTIPTFPKTKTAFIANPATGGSFTLSRGTTSEVTSVLPGPRFLPNGVYSWSAIVNPHYMGSGFLLGKFVLDVKCGFSGTASTTSTTNTVTTESIVVTTGTAVVSSSDDDDDDDHIDVSSSSSVQTVALAPTPAPSLPTSQTSSSLALPVSGATALPKISLPPPTPPLVHNPLPPPSPKVAPLALPVKTLPVPVRHEADDEEDDDEPSHTNSMVVVQAPTLLPAIEHLERFDEKKQKEIARTISKKEQQEIVNRVKSPAGCTDMKECAVYCEQKETRASSVCATFAQTRLPQPSPIKPSLVGSVPFERIEHILSDATVRPVLLPPVVKNPQEFQQFCTDLKNKDVCARILVENKLVSNETIVERTQALTQNHEEEKRIFTERTGVRVFIDSDNDELADYDEINIYRTDPKNNDTDRDGVPDGKEIALRTSPRSSTSMPFTATSSSVAVPPPPSFVPVLSPENHPLISGNTDSKLLMIKEVVALRNASSTLASGFLDAPRPPQLTFTGTAIPNSFVTLYIFSEPVVVMVKTNALGEWSYTLDKELPDGTHQVISAITDGDGRVLAKSEPLPFVKVAEAVTLGNVDVAFPVAQKEPGFFSGMSLYTLASLIVGVLGMSFLVIGTIVRRRDDGNGTMPM